MTTAVVILNWNGEGYLRQFLPVLIQHTTISDVEIIVADNASTDNSLVMLKRDFPSVKTIVLDKNYGFAGGYNKALKEVDADYFLLLNSDVEVTEGWLQPLIAHMNEFSDVAACQPKIKSFHQRTHFEHAGAAGGFIDYNGFPFCRGRIFGVVEEDRGQYDESVDVFWASGACMMVRSDLFWKVGGFDDDFFAHMEEIDLCWRFNSRGFRVTCVGESEVFHIGGGTLNVEHPRKTYLNFRNNLLMLYKNLPNNQLNKIMLNRLFFDYLAAIQLFVTGKPANAMGVFSGRRDFYKMRLGFVEKRKENLLFSTCTDKCRIYHKSIVVDYFIRQKRFFSKL